MSLRIADGARTRRIASRSPMAGKLGIHIVADTIAEVVADDADAIRRAIRGLGAAPFHRTPKRVRAARNYAAEIRGRCGKQPTRLPTHRRVLDA